MQGTNFAAIVRLMWNATSPQAGDGFILATTVVN
jgi:hypothetical protein